MKNLETRQKEAQERNSEHKKLTTQQKIQKLDLRFGSGVGAKKERVKLATQLQKENSLPKAEKQPKAKPVFASKAEERKWEHHQKQKQNSK